MKFIVDSAALCGVVSNVGKVVNMRNVMPVLSNLLLEAAPGGLSVTGADMENRVCGRMAVLECEGEAAFCLDSRKLAELLKAIPSGPVSFSVRMDESGIGGMVDIETSSGAYAMSCIDGGQYPQSAIGSSGERHVAEIPGRLLSEAICYALAAVGSDEFHPQLMGVHFDYTEDGLTVVATDTRQLVRYRTSEAQGAGLKCYTLSAKAAQTAKALFAKSDKVTVAADDVSAELSDDSFSFATTLLKGRYPDYNKVVPASSSKMLRINRSDFMTAIRRMSIVSGEGSPVVRLALSADGCAMSGENSMSSGKETLSGEYHGEDLTLAFNPHLMNGLLAAMDCEDVLIGFTESSRPFVISPDENPEGREVTLLAMPCNIAG